MEELITTDVLDREILEDARKKAYKILKTAEDTIAAKAAEWEKKCALDLESIRETYAERVKRTVDEISARLPLDKRRLRSETAEACLQKAVDAFLRSLGREKLLAIVEHDLLERLEACAWQDGGGNGPELRFSAMEMSEARAVLGKVLASLQKKPSGLKEDWRLDAFRLQDDGPDAGGVFPSVVLNTRGIKISASVSAAAEAMMKEKRAELASALLGKEVLDD